MRPAMDERRGVVEARAERDGHAERGDQPKRCGRRREAFEPAPLGVHEPAPLDQVFRRVPAEHLLGERDDGGSVGCRALGEPDRPIDVRRRGSHGGVDAGQRDANEPHARRVYPARPLCVRRGRENAQKRANWWQSSRVPEPMPPDDATPGTEPVETAAPAPRGDTARDATAPAARPTRVTPMAQAIIGAGVAAGIVEAAQGVGAALTANAGLETALFVLWQAFGTVVLPAVVLALPVGFVLDRGSMKSFGKDLRTAFTGDRDDATATVGVFAGLFSVGAAAATATLVGRIAKERVSANVTVTITVLAAFVSLAVFVALAGLTARAITPRLRKLAEGAGRGEEFLAGGVAPAVLLSLVVTGALAVLLPLPFVVTGGRPPSSASRSASSSPVAPPSAASSRARGVIAVVTLGLVGLSCPLTSTTCPRASSSSSATGRRWRGRCSRACARRTPRRPPRRPRTPARQAVRVRQAVHRHAPRGPARAREHES